MAGNGALPQKSIISKLPLAKGGAVGGIIGLVLVAAVLAYAFSRRGQIKDKITGALDGRLGSGSDSSTTPEDNTGGTDSGIPQNETYIQRQERYRTQGQNRYRQNPYAYGKNLYSPTDPPATPQTNYVPVRSAGGATGPATYYKDTSTGRVRNYSVKNQAQNEDRLRTRPAQTVSNKERAAASQRIADRNRSGNNNPAYQGSNTPVSNKPAPPKPTPQTTPRPTQSASAPSYQNRPDNPRPTPSPKPKPISRTGYRPLNRR